jgi:hypothetical protein
MLHLYASIYGLKPHFLYFLFGGMHLGYDLCNEIESGTFCVWHFTIHPFHKASTPPKTSLLPASL